MQTLHQGFVKTSLPGNDVADLQTRQTVFGAVELQP